MQKNYTNDIIEDDFFDNIGLYTEYTSNPPIIDFKSMRKYALEKGIEGRVITKFTVTKAGSIRNIRIVRSVYKSLDEEAIRIVKSLPKFVPGKIDGALVDIEYTLPVNFRLPPEYKTKK